MVASAGLYHGLTRWSLMYVRQTWGGTDFGVKLIFLTDMLICFEGSKGASG